MRPCALADNSRDLERTRAEGYLVASPIPPGRVVCGVYLAPRTSKKSVGPICLDDVDKALYACRCLTSIEAPKAYLCVLCVVLLVFGGVIWVTFRGPIVPIWSPFWGSFSDHVGPLGG